MMAAPGASTDSPSRRRAAWKALTVGCLCLVVHPGGTGVHAAAQAPAESPGTSYGEHLHQAADAAGKLIVAGIDLAAFGFVELQHHVLSGANGLWVLGRLGSEETKLALIDLVAKDETAALAYPAEYSSLMREAAFFVIRLQSPQGRPVSFAVLEYETGNIGRQLIETNTFVDILEPKEGDRKLHLVRRWKAVQTNLGLRRNEDRNLIYRFLEVDDSKSGPGKPKPGLKGNAKVMAVDMNSDEYPDLVIWTRLVVSRRLDEAGEDFKSGAEEVNVMYYSPAEKVFRNPVPLDPNRLPVDRESVWRRLFP